MRLRNANHGFTLLEVLIVLGLIAFIAGFIIVGFQNYTKFQRFDFAVGTVRTALSESHDNALRGVNGTAHGVKVASTSITLFDGNTYSSSDPTNTTVSFIDATLTFALTGGTDEIVFSALSGLPSATGTILVTGTAFSASSTVTIGGTGDIQ